MAMKSRNMYKTLLSVILVLGPSLVFGANGMPTEMGIAIVGGALAATFLNLDRVQRFKGGGFEAEM